MAEAKVTKKAAKPETKKAAKPKLPSEVFFS